MSYLGWKRVFIADVPRQVINAIALVAFYRSRIDDGPFFEINKYTNGDLILGALLIAMLTTLCLCIFDVAKLACAGVLYLVLLCHIQGNLKVSFCLSSFGAVSIDFVDVVQEYCSYRVDKAS